MKTLQFLRTEGSFYQTDKLKQLLYLKQTVVDAAVTSSLEYIWFVRLFGSKGSYLAFNRSREKTTHHFSFSSAALVSCGIRIYLHFIFWISSAVCCRSSNSTFCCQFTGVILSSFPQCPPSNLKTEGDRSPLFLPPGSGLICHPT